MVEKHLAELEDRYRNAEKENERLRKELARRRLHQYRTGKSGRLLLRNQERNWLTPP